MDVEEEGRTEMQLSRMVSAIKNVLITQNVAIFVTDINS